MTASGQQIELINRRASARRVMTSSKSVEWCTPPEWFRYLDLEFGFTLDPCSNPSAETCPRYYTKYEDGLAQSWADERVFMNPPYGTDIALWMEKAYEEARDNGALVVCFIPARVETEWWHSYAAKAAEIRFPKGRVSFVDRDGEADDANAPFPVAIVIFRPYMGRGLCRRCSI